VDWINKENLTLFIAVWGAGLSTYKAVSDYRKNVRRVKVELSYGFISQANILGPMLIILSAANVGNREVILNSMGYLLPDGKRSVTIEPQSDVRFPYALSEGKKCLVWKEQRRFAEELSKHGYSGKIKIRGYYQSATGEMFKSKPFDFDIESALIA